MIDSITSNSLSSIYTGTSTTVSQISSAGQTSAIPASDTVSISQAATDLLSALRSQGIVEQKLTGLAVFMTIEMRKEVIASVVNAMA